jgi:hypothetical protein
MNIHYQCSIARLTADHALTSGEVVVLSALWGRLRNPHAERPSVTVSYEVLARCTGLAVDTVRAHTRRLQRVGALVKCGSCRGQGTRYELRRPAEHRPEDLALAPFEPSAAEGLAAQVVEGLAQAKLLRPPAKRRRQRSAKPPVKPDAIALALEQMAGMPPKTDKDGKPKPTIPYSAKCGNPSAVAAAQQFIADRGIELFRRVCSRAKDQQFDGLSTPRERVHLFERPALVAELLAADRPAAPVVTAPSSLSAIDLLLAQ